MKLEVPPRIESHLIAVDDEATKARREIREEVLRLLVARDFKSLDAMAQEFRESKESLPKAIGV